MLAWHRKMTETHIEHVFNCTEETYWGKLFFAPEYNERMFKEALGFPKFQVTKLVETDAEISRRFDVVPALGPLPGPIKKLVGDNLGYHEDGVFDRKTRRYTLRITPSVLSSKIEITGVLFVEPSSPGKIKRILDARVHASIFGLGGLIEKTVLRDVTTNYDKAAVFTNAFLAEKGL